MGMADNEIPTGTRAVMIAFTTEKGTPRVTFDLIDGRWATKTLAWLTSAAISAVLNSDQGDIVTYKTHFIA